VHRFHHIVVIVCAATLLVAGCTSKRVTTPIETPETTVHVQAPYSLTHTVREGETLARIADLYYGDPSRAADIAALNGISSPDHLAPGSVLALEFKPGEWDAARRRAAALEPYNEGVDAMNGDELGKAEQSFRLALETAPELVDARYNLALVLMKKGRYPDAEQLLAPLATERPDDAEIGFALGNTLFYETRFDDAAAAFRRVLDHHADDRRAAFGWARALQEAGRRDEALAAWQAYLALDPKSSWADAARRNVKELQGGHP
jgi:tetratricopeptide (TPR) repeat protein